jgi:tripartite-type tricarboxylate transporter receptor subunit TctC
MFLARNVEPWGSTPSELAQTIDGEMAKWGPIIKRANIKL